MFTYSTSHTSRGDVSSASSKSRRRRMAPGHDQKTGWIKGLRSLCVSSRDFRLDGEKNISTSRLKKRIAYYDWGQRPCSLTSFARTSCGPPCRSGIRNSDLAVCQSGTRLHTSGGSPMNRLRPDLASHDNCGYETKIYSA